MKQMWKKQAETSMVDLQQAKILIVDDIAFNRKLLGTILQEAGFVNLDYAENGQQAIDKVLEHPIDMVLLDIMMPGIDGFEVCRKVRQDFSHGQLPILVQTALDSAEDCNHAFMSGASDLISKPINAIELINRVKVHLDNRFMTKALQDYQVRTRHELEQARLMQDSLLPSLQKQKDVSCRHNIELFGFYQPSTELSGDIWGIVEQRERLGVFIADFSGHGVGAALNTFRLQALSQDIRHLGADPAQILSYLNYKLSQMLSPGQFATMLIGFFEKDQFIYAAAGSTPPLLIDAQGHVIAGDSSGLPLGIKSDVQYSNLSLKIERDQTLLLFSDALADILAGGDVIAVAEVLQTMQLPLQPQQMVERLVQYVASHQPNLHDDLTLVSLQKR